MKRTTSVRPLTTVFAFLCLTLLGVLSTHGHLSAQATIEPNCRDTDSGRNYYVSGATSLKGADTQFDTCTPEGKVKEFYCKFDGSREVTIVGCAIGFVCSNGSCVVNANRASSSSVATAASSSAVSSQALCTDSDGGQNVKVKGTATTPKGTRGDICLSSRLVKEYYCYKDGTATAIRVCPKGTSCKDGACM